MASGFSFFLACRGVVRSGGPKRLKSASDCGATVAPPSDGLVSVALVSPGIRVRHSKVCLSRSGGTCRCRPTYQASVWSAREGKRVFKTFATLAEAKAWRSEAQVGATPGDDEGGLVGNAARGGGGLGRRRARAARSAIGSGHAYKPSAIRGYEASLVLRVLPELGGMRLSEVRRVDLQDFADRLCADGLDPSTVRNTLMPLRAIFRRAVARRRGRREPDIGPRASSTSEGARDRIASPAEAAELLDGAPGARPGRCRPRRCTPASAAASSSR